MGKGSVFVVKLKNSVIKVNREIDFISFGRGSNVLIVIPGLGDGLGSVRGKKILYSFLYRKFSSKFKVYVISRRNNLIKDFTTSEMADDIIKTMDDLKISEAYFLGISQGGMILEMLALRHPKRIKKMVLAVTSSRPNAVLEKTINNWKDLASREKFVELSKDIFENSYTSSYMKKLRLIYPFLGMFVRKCDKERFLIQADSCLKHNCFEKLEKIKIPTMVIGAENYKVLGVTSSYEISSKISGSELVIYNGFGHGVYNESEAFKSKVMNFFLK